MEALVGGHSFGGLRRNSIRHRLTKPCHLPGRVLPAAPPETDRGLCPRWTNGQAERLNRTVKDATVKAFHCPDLEAVPKPRPRLRCRLQLRQAPQGAALAHALPGRLQRLARRPDSVQGRPAPPHPGIAQPDASAVNLTVLVDPPRRRSIFQFLGQVAVPRRLRGRARPVSAALPEYLRGRARGPRQDVRGPAVQQGVLTRNGRQGHRPALTALLAVPLTPRLEPMELGLTAGAGWRAPAWRSTRSWPARRKRCGSRPSSGWFPIPHRRHRLTLAARSPAVPGGGARGRPGGGSAALRDSPRPSKLGSRRRTSPASHWRRSRRRSPPGRRQKAWWVWSGLVIRLKASTASA